MRRWFGDATCMVCGAFVDVPDGARLRTMMVSETAAPVVRVLYAGATEIHRCVMKASDRNDVLTNAVPPLV